jgi:hypothetical protein
VDTDSFISRAIRARNRLLSLDLCPKYRGCFQHLLRKIRHFNHRFYYRNYHNPGLCFFHLQPLSVPEHPHEQNCFRFDSRRHYWELNRPTLVALCEGFSGCRTLAGLQCRGFFDSDRSYHLRGVYSYRRPEYRLLTTQLELKFRGKFYQYFLSSNSQGIGDTSGQVYQQTVSGTFPHPRSEVDSGRPHKGQ